jgi:hypothetical protein
LKLAAACCAAVLLLAAAPASAPGASTAGSAVSDPNALTQPPSDTQRPAGHVRTAQDVVEIADRQPKVRQTLRRHPKAMPVAYLKGPFQWQVSYFGRDKRGHYTKELAQVIVDDRSGVAGETWTGFQVAWTMARGYPGAFGRRAGALYIWLPLCVMFVVPFFDPRRPFRLLHLDLLVLVSFSISLAFFSNGQIGVSVPLAYPPLAYLLVRMLIVARRRAADRPREPLRLLVPATWLLVGLIFLVGFRVALNVTNSNVIDVGYSGVVGADRLSHGKQVWGNFPKDNQHGDTYGPVNYYAYVPFEQAWPWSGRWDDLPAAHGAAVVFDLLTMLGLWLLGRRIRGPTMGIALAYAWAAYPFTLFVSNSNSNDSLVALLLVGALLLAASAPVRGALVALAGLTKFAPLALAPVFATHGAGDDQRGSSLRSRSRSIVLYSGGFVAAAALAMAPILIGGDLRSFYDHTLRFQQERGSPFSIWGLRSSLDWLQTVVQVGAVAFALAAAVLPRRRDVVGLAALAAAVLIALQLGVTHWFYLYIVWFLPLVLLALFARYDEPVQRTLAPRPAAA